MAPEQLRGEKVDVRTDIYAAGVVLYELVTAQRAHPEKDGPRLLHAILNGEPVPPRTVNPQITSALEAIILKAMTKEAAGRQKSAANCALNWKRCCSAAGCSPGLPVLSRSRSSVVVAGEFRAFLS
jgi:serine/threonine-protein kinase